MRTGAGLRFALAALVACSDGPSITSPEPGGIAVIVSRLLPNTGLAAQRARTAARSVSAGDSIVYVSLVPGTVPRGSGIAITNLATSFSLTAPLVNGGLDPVAVPALTGDTLQIVMADSAGGTKVLTIAAGPIRRLIVVRTDPPPGGTDVALNTQIVVVFSEPMDAGSVTPQTMQLRLNGQPVAGTVALSADGIFGAFRPAGALRPLTEYTLVVTTAVRTRAGLNLAREVVSSFTTGSGVGSIAFVGGFSGNAQIYTIAPDGSGLTQLTYDFIVPSGGPSWSADGAKMSFMKQGHIYVMNTDGTGVVRLFADSAADSPPHWSPDGTRLAFERCCDSLGYSQIFIITSQGTGLVQLTTDARFHESPVWSPDGMKIAFHAYAGLAAGQEFPDVYVINVDGTGLTDLTPDNPSHDMNPAWSPDGRKIAFASHRSGGMQIFVMNADGTGVVNLTNDSGVADISPTWSPDGSRIAFMGHLGGNEEIFVMNADGSGVVSLVVGEDPQWGPP